MLHVSNLPLHYITLHCLNISYYITLKRLHCPNKWRYIFLTWYYITLHCAKHLHCPNIKCYVTRSQHFLYYITLKRLHCPNLILHYITLCQPFTLSQSSNVALHHIVQKSTCYITLHCERLHCRNVTLKGPNVTCYITVKRFQCSGHCSPVTPNSMSLTIDAPADWKCQRFCW